MLARVRDLFIVCTLRVTTTTVRCMYFQKSSLLTTLSFNLPTRALLSVVSLCATRKIVDQINV